MAISSVPNLQIKSEVLYSGIVIRKDQQRRTIIELGTYHTSTMWNKLVQQCFNFWYLSLRGRILFTKAEKLSRLTYAGIALYLEDNFIKEIVTHW